VQVNGIVHIRTVLPAGVIVPLGWVAVGDPVHLLPPGQHDAIWRVQKPLDFPGYVFGVKRPPDGQTIMPDVMPRYAHALNLRHADDRVINEDREDSGTRRPRDVQGP
jgi:hypothetical protein